MASKIPLSLLNLSFSGYFLLHGENNLNFVYFFKIKNDTPKTIQNTTTNRKVQHLEPSHFPMSCLLPMKLPKEFEVFAPYEENYSNCH